MDVPLFLRLFGRFVLVDVAGRPLVTVQRKASTVTIPSLLIQVYLGLGIDRRCCCQQAFSLYREWEAFRGDGHGHNGGELLFTAKKSTIVQVRTHMDIFLASNRAQEVCDFRIIKSNSFYERSADIYLGNSNTVIAQVNNGKSVC
jgi:hypothetical protein